VDHIFAMDHQGYSKWLYRYALYWSSHSNYPYKTNSMCRRPPELMDYGNLYDPIVQISALILYLYVERAPRANLLPHDLFPNHLSIHSSPYFLTIANKRDVPSRPCPK